MADTPSSRSERIKANLTALRSRFGSKDEQEVRRSRRTPVTSSVQVIPDKNRQPLGSYRSMGILQETDADNEQHLQYVREVCRNYYRVHHLVPTAIDIYSRFPVQGLEFDCKDKELVEFYDELFINNLDYENFLVDFGREYFIAGEVTSLGEFNETLGVWVSEEILNPDQLSVSYLPLEKDYRVTIEPPQYLKTLVNEQDPIWEYNALLNEQPDLVEAVRRDQPIEVSSVLISRLVDRVSPWDLRGTPRLLRSFRQLMMEESLNAAQDAVADRLYAPFILATLGMKDIGDGTPWIPNADELEEFNGAIQDALMGDFKLLTHHFGIDIKSVFGRESMPRFDNDYDRIEKKILQTWGIGESLLSGSSNGAYASSALNRELVTQLMTTYQNGVRKHYRKRAEIVAEAQEHFDYELKGGRRIPVYEEVLVVDEETGQQSIQKRPKLLIPEIKFKTLNLRDEAQERSFLMNLKNAGVPISDRALAVNIDFDVDDEIDKTIEDKVSKTVAEQEFKVRAVKRLRAADLPIPKDLQETADAMDEDERSRIPESPFDDSDESQDGQDGEAVTDISAPAPAPNIAPEDESKDNETSSDYDDDGEVSDGNALPQNQIRQRPEISDEMRKSHSSRIANTFSKDYRSVRGLRGQLSDESVREAIQRPVPRPVSLRRVNEGMK